MWGILAKGAKTCEFRSNFLGKTCKFHHFYPVKTCSFVMFYARKTCIHLYKSAVYGGRGCKDTSRF